MTPALAADRATVPELPAWVLSDPPRGGAASPLATVMAPLAGLLVLRWTAFLEAEEEAVAAFDDRPFTPVLPAALRRPTWGERAAPAGRFVAGLELWTPHQGAALGRHAGLVVPLVRKSAQEAPEIFAALLAWVAGLDFETAQGRAAAAAAFERLLARGLETQGRSCGELLTPGPVAELMVEIADPRPGDQVYDPCCGIGGLLMAAARRLESAVAHQGPGGERDLRQQGLFGVEIDPAAVAIALARLALAGFENLGLARGDALERALPEPAGSGEAPGFDCILAAPPWSGRIGAAVRPYPVPGGGIENLFLQHAMAHLRPGGRAVLALSQGSLFRLGADREVRRTLLSELRVEGVFALPEGALAPCTLLPASLVLFRRAAPRHHVRFVRVPKNATLPGDLPALLAEAGERPEERVPDAEVWDVPVASLAARDYELLDKRTGALELESALARLTSADPRLRLVPLDGLAEVFPGASGCPLLGGDLLMATSGMAGEVGTVVEAHLGHLAAAAGDLAVIRPRAEVTAAFLAALLGSPGYREWIAGHASGSALQHLSLQVLRRLVVPVPPVPVQAAVLRQLAGGGDALALLLRSTIGGGTDPLGAWLEQPVFLVLLRESPASLDAAKTLSAVGRTLLQLRSLPNPTALRWRTAAVELGTVLAGLDLLPEGAPRLAVLELARGRSAAVRQSLATDASPAGSRLRLLLAGLERLLDEAVGTLLRPVSIDLSAAPAEVVVGVPTEVRLQLRNSTLVGLRSLLLATEPNVGTGSTGYLAEGASAIVPVTVVASDAGLPFEIALRWEAVRLDGAPARGEARLELAVRSTREAVRARDLGPSPYIVGNPVDREEMFYGRADVLARIRRQVGAATHANVILLEGNRRTGKTSLLAQLQKKEALRGWLPVYCSFQDAEGDETRTGISTRNVYRLLARTVAWTLFDAGIPTWFAGAPLPPEKPPEKPPGKRPWKVELRAALDHVFAADHPFETFAEYLEGALAAARPHRLLLLLDEFDKLQEGIDAGVTSPQVPENLRHLLQHQAGLSAILSGSRRLKHLREESWSALFGLGYRIGLGALPFADACRLVTEPVADRLHYLPNARARLVELCASQPFLVQSLANRVFEWAAESGERTITTGVVDENAAVMVQDNEHFQTLWDSARTARRRLVLALCQRLTAGPDAVSLDLLLGRLAAYGVRVPRPSLLGDDVEHLRELEIIDLDKSYRGGTYRITVPLLGMWIAASVDFDDVVTRAREEAEETPS